MALLRKMTRNLSHPMGLRHPVQPTAFGVSLNLNLQSNLQSQSHWNLFNGTWRKRPRELDHPLRFEIEEMTLQMQEAVALQDV